MPLAVLDFLRRIAFAFAMLYMLARLHNMQLWRGKGALDADVSVLCWVSSRFVDRWGLALHAACSCGEAGARSTPM